MLRLLASFAVGMTVGGLSVITVAQATEAKSSTMLNLKECVAVFDPAKRLACFDMLAPKTDQAQTSNDISPPQPPPIPLIKAQAPTSSEPSSSKLADPTTNGSWRVSESKSPIDDSRSLVAMLDATDSTGGTMFGDADATLIARCREKKLDVYIATSKVYFGINSAKSVITRIGADKAVTDSWTTSTNGKSIGLWASSGQRGARFARQLIDNGKELVVRSDTYNDSSMTSTFSLLGASEALQPVLDLCSKQK